MGTRVAGRVVTPAGVVDGYVEIVDDRIGAVVGDRFPGQPAGGPSAGQPSPGGGRLLSGDGPPTLRPLAGGPWVVPGFVDIHCHGGGGHTFTDGDPGAASAAAAFHLGHGTTSVVASLVSTAYEVMRDTTAALAPLVSAGTLAGVHLEGPYLSGLRRGAHDPAALRDPSLAELRDLIDVGAGVVRMVTLAPELPGALDAIALLTSAGVVTAVGHTDATYEQTLAAVAAGATVGTHLFNGARPPHHREPGPTIALLAAPGVTCELIPDGVHLHDGALSFAARVAGCDRVALVTDATAAAGMPDGRYDLGGHPVTVHSGVARLTADPAPDRDSTRPALDGGPAGCGDGPLAGSTLTMDAALRRMVALGFPLVDACRMVATTPARAIGLGGRAGALAPGLRADLVVLDDQLRVQRVMRHGVWV